MPEITCPHHNLFRNRCDCISCRIYQPGSATVYEPGICKVCGGKGKIIIDPDSVDCPHHQIFKNKCDCPTCRIYKPGSKYVHLPGICKECVGTGKVAPSGINGDQK